MATSYLRTNPEGSAPSFMLPEESIGLTPIQRAELDAVGGNALTNSFDSALTGSTTNRLAAQESSLRAAGDPMSLAQARSLRSRITSLEGVSQVQDRGIPHTYEEVMQQGVGAVPAYLAGAVGSMAGSVAPQVMSGGAMNLAATGLQALPHPIAKAAGTALRWASPAVMFADNQQQLKGEGYRAMRDDPTIMRTKTAQEIDDTANLHGVVAGALDTVLPSYLAKSVGGKALTQGFTKMGAGKRLLADAALEAGTETLQQIDQHAVLEHLNPNRDTSGDLSENINSGLGAFFGGGAMGAGHHMADSAWARAGTRGDGKNGDVIDLGEAPAKAAKPSILEELNGGTSRFTKSADARAFAELLKGNPEAWGGNDDEDHYLTAAGGKRQAMLLAELGKRKEPEAAAHAQAVAAVDTSQLGSVLDPALDEAASWLVPKLHLTPADIGNMKNNAETPIRFSGTPDMFGNNGVRVDDSRPPNNNRNAPRVGGAYTDQLDKSMLPDGVRAKLNADQLKAAQAEVKLHGQTTRLVTDRLWNEYRTHNGRPPSAADRDMVQDLAHEVMAVTTVAKPTAEETRRALRLAEQLVRTVGPGAAGILTGIARTRSSPLFDRLTDRVDEYANVGGNMSHYQEQLSRTEAAIGLTNLIPPTVERRLLNDHGIDLNNEKDQNDLLDLLEDFHDGRSSVPLMRLNKLLTAPVVKAMGEYLGNKIQPRLHGEEAVAQEHTSGATQTTDSDTEGASGGRLVSGELMGEQSEAPTEFDAVGHEKSMDKVMPESLVFHHSGNAAGSVRDIKDAWKEDDKGNLPQLLREGDGTPLLERVKKLAQQAAAHLGAGRDRYVIGNPASKDPLEAAGATSAKKLMDDMNMQDSKRAQLLFKYLAKENKGLDVGELEAMYDSVSYLTHIDRALTDTVVKRESLSPSGEKLSIPQSAEINAPHINYEKLADLAANPADAAKVNELFKAGTISKYVGLAQIVRRAKAAAEQHLTSMPGYSEFVSKVEAEDGRTPEFREYVNDFFGKHHVVVAEQPTNRDHLQMNLPEFREMVLKGKDNLESAWVSVQGAPGKAQEGELHRVRASMNLIRFKSEHSGAKDGEVALPAYMLVAWVRKMRNAHETDGENAPAKTNSQTKQTEEYKRDLMEGITTVMQGGLTDGLPWIINARGEREDFGAATMKGTSRQTAYMNEQGHLGSSTIGSPEYDPYAKAELTALDRGTLGLSWKQVGLGELPPSLDLDGITVEKADSDRAQGAKQRREAEDAHTASQSSLNAERGLAEKEERKNAELSQDDRDVQDADSVENAEDEANGSRTREEERANLKFMTSVMVAAADKAPRPLTVGGAMLYASRVADDLWRTYIGGDRKEAMARVMSYVRATDKEKYNEDHANDAHIMKGLWAEYHKAAEDSDEQEAALARIKAHAASNAPKQTIKHQAVLDPDTGEELIPIQYTPITPTTAAVGSGLVGGQHYNFPLAALLTPRHMAALNPKDVKVMTMLRSRVASELAGMYQAKRLSDANLGKLVNFLSGHTDRASQATLDAQSGTPAEVIKDRTPWASTRVYAADRIEFLTKMAAPYREMIAKRGPAKAVEVVGWAGHQFHSAGTEGSSSGKPLVVAKPAKPAKLTTADQMAHREAEKGNYKSLGVARTADTSVSSEQVAEETADVNADLDKLTRVLGNSLGARKATTMEQKAEPLPAENQTQKSPMAVAIAKRQDYLDNPPADYTTEQVTAIAEWAQRQSARVLEEIRKIESNMDDPQFDHDRYDRLTDTKSDLDLLTKAAQKQAVNDRDMKEADERNGTNLFGGNPDVKRSSETIADANGPTVEPTAEQQARAKMASANPPSSIQVTSALAHFKRTLSGQVKVMFAESFPDMTHGADYNTLEHLARISTANPLKIMQLAYHESMHGFFDTVLNAKGHEKIKAMMLDAMSEPKLYARLKDMLKDSPQALADMERDPEERVAYAYQFWAAGMLNIAKKPATFFEHVQQLMRRVFNAVGSNEKALAMFEAFHKGELKEPSAAGAAMLKIMNTGEWKAQFMKRFDKQAQAVYAEVMANHLIGRNSESATARMLNNKFYSNPAYAEDTAHEGMINRTQFKRKKFINALRLALRPLAGVNADRDLKALGEALNAHTTPELEHVAKAKVAVQALLKQYHEYAREAGLDIGERLGTDGDTDYYTRVLDLEKLIDSKEAFVNMLMTNYAHVLKPAISRLKSSKGATGPLTEIDVAHHIHQMYIDHNGVDDHKLSAMREDGVLSPFFAAQNKRELYWIRDEDIAPFLNTDVVGTMTQYISQGVRAAEYARAFGKGGIELKDAMAREGDVQMVDKNGEATLYTEDGPVAKELKEAAEKAGLKGKGAEEWVDRRIDDLRRSHGAYEGSLGKDITARTRNLQSGVMLYQTLRLLSLMIFSSMLDPNGIRVAGGTSDDMWDAYKRGFAGLWNNYKDLFLGNPFGSRDPDAKEMAALEAGVIDSDMELEEMGQVHSSEYSSGMTRRVGHAFFKTIGITQWDRDMRVSATDAARKSIVSSYNNEVPAHSARWLEEIGLKREQVYIKDGELIVSARELARQNNITRAEAAKLLEPTHLAINRWVNRAIVSPNAGLRPTRFSDPHFAMFAQFKSFTYAFQETTLRYAMHEAEQGNFNSGAQLARGIPIMIVADMTKAMVTGGGSLPGYMANWTMADWVSHAINRSGVGGTGTFATDILNGDVVNTVAGPTVGHAWDTVKKVATGEVGSAVASSIPVVKQFSGAF